MFDWLQVRVLAGPLKDIYRLVHCPSVIPALSWLCFVSVIVLLEGEPSAQSEVPRALDQVWTRTHPTHIHTYTHTHKHTHTQTQTQMGMERETLLGHIVTQSKNKELN